MNVEEEIKELRVKCAALRARIKWLVANQDKLADLPALGAMSGSVVDFDNLEHKDVIKVVRAFGGKWSKSASATQGRIDYETVINGVAIRCWNGHPPPSCKLIEVEEHVPEQVIPAHTRKIVKMSCHPELPAVIATAAAKAVPAQADEVPF